MLLDTWSNNFIFAGLNMQIFRQILQKVPIAELKQCLYK